LLLFIGLCIYPFGYTLDSPHTFATFGYRTPVAHGSAVTARFTRTLLHTARPHHCALPRHTTHCHTHALRARARARARAHHTHHPVPRACAFGLRCVPFTRTARLRLAAYIMLLPHTTPTPHHCSSWLQFPQFGSPAPLHHHPTPHPGYTTHTHTRFGLFWLVYTHLLFWLV